MLDNTVGRLGSHLENKKICLMITGSIAGFLTPILARHFMQYGADVVAYLSEEGERYVTKDALRWATGNEVVTELSALKTEHLLDVNAYVVAPATYNTINKFANGIADNAITSTLASALGRLEKNEASIIIAPTMHGTMYNSTLKSSIEKLRYKIWRGVKFIEPKNKYDEEGNLEKAQMASISTIVASTVREINQREENPLSKKKILITAGPIPTKVDDVRIITNVFSGQLGIDIANEAYLRGAETKLILGYTLLEAPEYLNVKRIKDFDSYYNEVLTSFKGELGMYDWMISAAAVADFKPKQFTAGKIPSESTLTIETERTPKVIKEVRKSHPGLNMATFKYERGVTFEELNKIAMERISEGYEIVVANRGEDIDLKKGKHRAYIYDKERLRATPNTKKEIASKLLDLIGEKPMKMMI